MAIEWETLDASDICVPGKGCSFSVPVSTFRAKVPHGWLVMITLFGHPTLTFYPDPSHEWTGATAEIERLHTAVAAAVGAPERTTLAPWRMDSKEDDRVREAMPVA